MTTKENQKQVILDFFNSTSYTDLYDLIYRKMALDEYAGKLDLDDFRRIGRGLEPVFHYLDHHRELRIAASCTEGVCTE